MSTRPADRAAASTQAVAMPEAPAAAGRPTWERLAPLLSVAALGVLWWVGYRTTRFIASPFEVAGELPEFLSRGETWTHIAYTVRRVAIGLLVGVAAGAAVAVAMTWNRAAKRILGVYVALALRLPSTIAAILALAVFQRSETAYVAVVGVITFPFVAVGLLHGMEATDRRLDSLAVVYRISVLNRLRHVLLPSIAPFIFSSLRNAHALAWKVIVVAEIFGTATLGFGARFNLAFDYFQLVDLMLWLLVFVAFVLVADYGILRMIERYVFRWRVQKG